MRINKKSKIFIAGHNGMVGSSILRKLKDAGFKNILIANRKKLDLLNQTRVFSFLKKNKPHMVIIAAARVGGIFANSNYKSKFIYENLQIQNNLIHGSYLAGVKNLFFLGSSCIYPKKCKRPIKEKYLLTSSLEKTNDAYAIAKISGLIMCDNYSQNYGLNYKCLMPTNLYGPNDNYHLQNSHFFPALIRKVYSAKLNKKKYVKVWGTGKPLRELLYVDDLADAILFFLNKKIKQPFLNIGSGKEYTIKWYVNFLIKELNVKTKIKFDRLKPDGVKSKLLDIKLAKSYGWKATTPLKIGLQRTIKDFETKYSR
jgi:GDP-L-fucose synthase